MSGLFAELHRTAQAINAQSQGVYTAGRNMANANNPAYARQRVVLGDRGMIQTPTGPQSLGLEVQAVQNIRDALLDRQVAYETSLTSSLEVQADAYYKAEIALGQQIDRQNDASFVEGATSTDSANGLSEALDGFFNSFSSLAADPRSTSERQLVFQRAQTLISRLHSVDDRLVELQDDITAQIDSDLDRVNSLLEAIRSLNQQIGRFEVGQPGAAIDLRDQRQAKIEELSKYIDVEAEDVTDSSGQIRLLSRDAGDVPVVLLDASKGFTPIAFNGTNFTGGTSSTVLESKGGRLLGLVTARDGAVADVRTGLDKLARQLVNGVNAAYAPTGEDFFDAGNLTAATISLDAGLTAEGILTSADPTTPGANEIALAMADVAGTSFSTASGAAFNGTIGGYYRGLVSSIANTAASVNGRLEDQTVLQQLVLERRDSVSGVSLDEEMASLVQYQRAFDASARVMRIVDEMLETIISQLGS